MIALALLLIAQTQTQTHMAAVEPIAWVRLSNLVVFHHRQTRCHRDEKEACAPGGARDVDQHTLRAVDIKDGKERWQSSSHPLLLGELRDANDEVVAIIASSLAGSTAVLLDPMNGATRATCTLEVDSGARFHSRLVDAKGSLFVIHREITARGGVKPPPPKALLLRASRQQDTDVFDCSFALYDDDPLPGLLQRSAADDRVAFVTEANKQKIEVAIGSKKRTFVILDPPTTPCPSFKCKPIP